MSETLYRHKPDESFDDHYATLPLEMAEDFSLWTAELQESLGDLALTQIEQLNDAESSNEISLKERYNLPFEPEKTIRDVGSIGLLIVMTPDAFQREIQKEALDTMADVEKPETQETTGAYAQDKPEYQEYVAQAESIIYNLRYGDESGLSALPQNFQEALSVRMNQRIQELEDGIISDGEFGLEVKKMISVACIGLDQASGPTLR